MPMPNNLSRAKGSFKTACNSAFKRSTIGLGNLAGPNKPTQELRSKSGTPLSMKVGTSGNEAERLALLTATGCNCPVLMWPMAPATAV